MTNIDTAKIEDSDLQEPSINNKYSPFHDSIQRHSSALFEEIRENLSRTIQQDELYPGFSIWSGELKQFISLYGFNFTKIDHLKLIDFYLAILTITDLSYDLAKTCFDMLYILIRFVISLLVSPIQN
jgi:hypothetical protein